MIEIILQCTKILAPILLTSGLIFFITRYSLLRNKTENIEKSYDRFYYPCYVKLKEYELEKKYQETLDYIKNRSLKWNKYVDKTTLKCIENFNIRINTKYKKIYYNYLYDDIYKHNRKYRIRLGYPEPLFYNSIKYLTFKGKLYFVTVCVVLAIYINLIIIDLLHKIFAPAYNFIFTLINLNTYIEFYLILLLIIIFIWLLYVIGIVGATILHRIIRIIRKIYLRFKKNNSKS